MTDEIIHTQQNGTVVELVDGGENNLYHIFMYMIMNFIQCNTDENIIYYYPKSNSNLLESILGLLPSNFHRHYIKHPNLEYKPFIPGAKFLFDRNFADPEWAYPYQYNFLRILFSHNFTPKNRPGLFIYISRNRDSKYRQITNEEKLINVLRPFGFKTITLSELTITKQIKVFAEADIILTPHGAGLTYLLFSNPELTVIELTDTNKCNKHYWHLAWHFGLDYYRFLCNADTDNNFTINIELFQKFLLNHPKINSKIN